MGLFPFPFHVHILAFVGRKQAHASGPSSMRLEQQRAARPSVAPVNRSVGRERADAVPDRAVQGAKLHAEVLLRP